jgi:hypothetical protein
MQRQQRQYGKQTDSYSKQVLNNSAAITGSFVLTADSRVGHNVNIGQEKLRHMAN